MSKGYIVIAQNTKGVDYLKQAYALALNLKLTQSKVSNLTRSRSSGVISAILLIKAF